MADCILIEGLEVWSRIGVPDEERAEPQRLTANVVLEPVGDFRALDDKIENTVDYFAVAEWVKMLAMARPRHLIETLAEELAGELLTRFPLRSVKIELRKYILPDAAFVAVQLQRERPASSTQV